MQSVSQDGMSIKNNRVDRKLDLMIKEMKRLEFPLLVLKRLSGLGVIFGLPEDARVVDLWASSALK